MKIIAYLLGAACLFAPLKDGFCARQNGDLESRNAVNRITKPVSYGEFIEKKLDRNIYTNIEYTVADRKKYGNKIPEEVTSLGARCFANVRDLKEITIPANVINIGVSCFEKCSALENVEVEGNDARLMLGAACFDNTSLTEESANKILRKTKFFGSRCFFETFSFGKKDLREKGINLIIPRHITKISDSYFSWNPNLTSVRIEADEIELGNRCFSCCSLTADSVNKILQKSQKLENSCFWCNNFGDEYAAITIPANITNIPVSCFESATMNKVNIEAENVTLEAGSFANCKNLQAVKINSKSVKLDRTRRIGCFENCISLPDASVNDILKKTSEISSSCFKGCSSLYEIIIPKNIKKLGEKCFANCDNLSRIVFENPDVARDANCFEGCNNLKETVDINGHPVDDINKAFKTSDFRSSPLMIRSSPLTLMIRPTTSSCKPEKKPFALSNTQLVNTDTARQINVKFERLIENTRELMLHAAAGTYNGSTARDIVIDLNKQLLELLKQQTELQALVKDNLANPQAQKDKEERREDKNAPGGCANQ